MILIHRNHHNIFAEAVNDNACQAIAHLQLHRFLFTTEHAETFSGIISHIQFLKMFSALPGLIGKRDPQHLVNSEMLDQTFLRIKSHQIIVLIIPG